MTKTFVVTITPKHQSYAGSWASGEYTVEVFARDRPEALRRARADYSAENGRMNPASFRASIKKEDQV